MRAGEIYDKALSNRASPAPYIWEVDGGFHVGWYDGAPNGFSEVYFHDGLENAATDFVLAYWGLPRLLGKRVRRKAAIRVFTDAYQERQEHGVLGRTWRAIRKFLSRWLDQ